MESTNPDSYSQMAAGTVARQFLDRMASDVGHTFIQEIVHDIVDDFAKEFSPSVVFGEIFKDMSGEINDLKPANLLRYAIFGKE